MSDYVERFNDGLIDRPFGDHAITIKALTLLLVKEVSKHRYIKKRIEPFDYKLEGACKLGPMVDTRSLGSTCHIGKFVNSDKSYYIVTIGLNGISIQEYTLRAPVIPPGYIQPVPVYGWYPSDDKRAPLTIRETVATLAAMLKEWKAPPTWSSVLPRG